ncbi:hypothetical protein MM236_06815 [Belliella sp. DSM 107340]|uniref:Uncharacterized protein n=1 Tax=Belliella calami TaxID=2923436 RepID=A0ABS9UMA5_9BACT|nr:hypothetical protein [Belliella calami]MCH7397692.1 hypothetical protein [Belliella calami]
MWDDFDNDDFDEDDEAEFQRERDEKKKHPLAVKSKDILELTFALVGSLDEARSELYGSLMIESASILGAKFSGAHAVDSYVIKMENAVIMKVHARSLGGLTYQLSMEETHAEEHLQLLRDALDEFKALFKEWIKTFESAERYDDGWGLFCD